MQTLPQLVYIIPFIYLMPVSIVPGIVAGVLYAFPVTLRLVERGVRDVAPASVEAASAFGASRRQVLTKVKLPLAGDAVMLGVNQAIVMVLAVVVIGGLVGSGGLGYEVAQGLVSGQFGQGVIASRRDPRSRNRARPRHARDEASERGRRSREQDHAQREGGIECRYVRGGALTGAAGVALVAIAALAVSGSAFGGGAQSCGTVIINEQSWAGSTANTYVAKYVLEKRLGCKVKITNITEGTPYFQAMRDGKVDVALEDWDNCEREVGPAVPQGQVGPGRRAERHPRSHRLVHPALPAQAVPVVQDLEGSQGQGDGVQVARVGLAGDVPRRRPLVQQKDKKLIEALGLNLKHVVAGAEPAQVARLDAAVQAEEARALLLVRRRST